SSLVKLRRRTVVACEDDGQHFCRRVVFQAVSLAVYARQTEVGRGGAQRERGGSAFVCARRRGGQKDHCEDSSPELKTMARKDLARSRPRMESRRMASVPTAKLSAATIKKLRTTLAEKAANCSRLAGRRTGKTTNSTSVVGSVCIVSLKPDSPMAEAERYY